MQKDVSGSETIKRDYFLRRILRQGRNYSTVVAWLLYRAFRGQHWRLALAFMFSMLHLGTQAAAIFIIYWYGKQMEQSGLVTVPFLDLHISLKDDPHWLWAIVAVVTVCFAVSAALLYLSRKQILDMLEQSSARSLERLVLASLRVPDPRAPLATQLFEQHHITGLAMGDRRGVLIAANFANAFTGIIGGLGAAVFLFRIDLPLTLVIVVSALLAALFLYPLTLRASRSAKEREKVQDAFRTEMRQLYDDPNSLHTVEGIKTADDLSRVFMMRRRVLTEIVFATEIGITILLGVVIYYMASRALAGKEQWAVFIAYIGALRMTLVGAAGAIRAFASVSRYYPQIVRYHLFMKDIAKIDLTPLAEVKHGDTVILGTLQNGEDVAVKTGRWVTLLTRRRIREGMCVLVHAKLQRSGEPVASFIIDPTDARIGAGGIAGFTATGLSPGDEQALAKLRQELKDKVTIVVTGDADKAGTFGETYVLTEHNEELWRFAALGTEEAGFVLQEFKAKVAAKGARGDMLDEEEEDL